MNRDVFKPRQVLAQNLKGLMQTREGPRTQTELAKRSGVAQATIGRILRAEPNARIETVAAIAEVYGLEAWQLMVAGMAPTNPPVLMPVSPREKALYERLRATAREIADLESPEYKIQPK